MYIKIITNLLLILTILFTGCITPNEPSSKSDTNEGGKGTQLMATIGGAIFSGLGVYVGNKLKRIDKNETKKEREKREDRERKQLLAGFVIGGAAGYIIGGKLADMQKRYKGEEEVLLSNIVKIDKETEILKDKNKKLILDVEELDNKFRILEQDREIKNENRNRLKKNLAIELNDRKQKLKDMINNYNTLSNKVLSSKSKVNQYNYKKQDKKEILKSIQKLSLNLKKEQDELRIKVASIDKKLRQIS